MPVDDLDLPYLPSNRYWRIEKYVGFFDGESWKLELHETAKVTWSMRLRFPSLLFSKKSDVRLASSDVTQVVGYFPDGPYKHGLRSAANSLLTNYRRTEQKKQLLGNYYSDQADM